MSDIINAKSIIKQLEKHRLKITDKKLFTFYIENYNVNTVINSYSLPFMRDKPNGVFHNDASSDQIIALYQFEQDFSNHLLRFILKLEKRLNTNVAYEVINDFRLEDRCLFKLKTEVIREKVLNNFSDVDTGVSFDNFINKLIKYCDTNDATKDYINKKAKNEIKKWENLPLDLMCLTWSFATTFTFFIALNDTARMRILARFGLMDHHRNGFIDFIKNVIHVRNMISHNYAIYNSDLKYKTVDLSHLYESVTKKTIKPGEQMNLVDMIELIEHFVNDNSLTKKTLKYINDSHINEIFKQKIKLMCDIRAKEEVKSA